MSDVEAAVYLKEEFEELDDEVEVPEDDIEESEAISDEKINCSSNGCKLSFNKGSILQYDAHSNSHNDHPHKCSFEGCTLSFSKPSTLNYHINVHLNRRPFKCTFEGCDRSYSYPSHLKRHALTHDVEKSGIKSKCEHCLEEFSNSSNLKRHILRRHGDALAYTCKECNIQFKNHIVHDKHMHKVHNASMECRICGKSIKSMNQINKHYSSHKSYLCTEENCLKVYQTKSSHREHVLTHLSGRKFTCADCGKVLISKASLTLHVVTHMHDRKVFYCEYEGCDRYYYFDRNLKQHIQIFHLKNKFQCDYCKFEFSTKQKVQQHIVKQHLTNGKSPERKQKAQE